MSKTLNGRLYIITDNFYPKRFSKYNCSTLSNVNIKCLNNKMLVFNNSKKAYRYLSLTDKDLGYHIEYVKHDDLMMICKCFDLLPTYV
jgi:hypothetical protein